MLAPILHQDGGAAYPLLEFGKGTRKYIVTQSDAQAKATELSNRIRTEKKRISKRQPQYTLAVGFDIEWRVMYVTGQAPRAVALLQLALLQGGKRQQHKPPPSSSSTPCPCRARTPAQLGLVYTLRPRPKTKPPRPRPLTHRVVPRARVRPCVSAWVSLSLHTHSLTHRVCFWVSLPVCLCVCACARVCMRVCGAFAEHQVCFLFQVMHCGFPEALCAILRDPSILKCGVCISADIHKLERDYPDVQVHGAVELGPLFPEETESSLAALVTSQLGRRLPKTPSIRTGNWEALPLSEAQLDYAAKDALASILLFRKAEDDGATVRRTPEELALARVAKTPGGRKPGACASLPAKVSTIRSTPGIKSKFVVHDLMQTGQFTLQEVAAMRNIKLYDSVLPLCSPFTAWRGLAWPGLQPCNTVLLTCAASKRSLACNPVTMC